ncbi:MAG: hypothetical protein PHX69_02495 [Simplicispira sp.]|uniref:hypothetical protein n=1 Tax=Simplicispira sp. TaxID=2015802 RepID=UPI002590C2DF|nr:hypothetical protein [Simplicispira sp.]MDD2690636.1 hypothetical protein [Simplicispira sp.]
MLRTLIDTTPAGMGIEAIAEAEAEKTPASACALPGFCFYFDSCLRLSIKGRQRIFLRVPRQKL